MRGMKPTRFLPGGEGEDVRLITGPKEVKMMPLGAGHRSFPSLGLAMIHIASIVSTLHRVRVRMDTLGGRRWRWRC